MKPPPHNETAEKILIELLVFVNGWFEDAENTENY